MNKTNYFKIFTIAAFAFCLNTTVNAQSGSSKMDREKAKPRVQQTEISAKKEDAKTTWIYSIARVTVDKDRISVAFEKSSPKLKTRSAEMAYKISVKNEEGLKEAADSFQSESDVLNYLADQRMELVSVVIDNKEGNVKTYYLRTKAPE